MPALSPPGSVGSQVFIAWRVTGGQPWGAWLELSSWSLLSGPVSRREQGRGTPEPGGRVCMKGELPSRMFRGERGSVWNREETCARLLL